MSPELPSYKTFSFASVGWNKNKLDCPLRAVSGKRGVFEPTQVEQLMATYPHIRQG